MANSTQELSFADICSLLNELENLRKKYRAPGNKLTRTEFSARKKANVDQWTKYYKPVIMKDSDSILATLSLLFPDLQADRTYTMKEHALSKVVSRVLGMGARGENGLRNWRLNDGDFGAAMERIMKGRVSSSGLKLLTSRAFMTRTLFSLQSSLTKVWSSWRSELNVKTNLIEFFVNY